MPEAADVAWDLEPLVYGEGEAGALRLLGEAAELADTFAAAYAGKVAELDEAGLAAAVAAMEELSDKIGRAGNYAMLRFSTDTSDPANGALLQKVQEQGAQIETKLLFFDLEWAALDDARADVLLAAPGVEKARHHLKAARRYRPHLLTEPEEKILTEKGVTGSSAWARLFGEQVSALTVPLPGEAEPVALDVALSRLMSPDGEVRRTTAEAVTETLAPGLRTRAFIYNTLMADKATDDRLRKYPSWIASRNLANEASDESVQALLDAVRNRYEIARRWYSLKAKLLGVERIKDYDRMAAVVAADDENIPWDEAKDIVLDAYRSFAPSLGETAESFFTGGYIDAPVRPGKRGGAFCAYTVPSAHPYVMLNYTSRRRDVLTLAHELGHGVHAALARPRGIFEQHTPLTLAETASVFGETLVFGRLLDRTPDPEARLSLLAESIEGSIATVFRQCAMNHYEHLAHTARREQGELSVDDLSGLWAQSQAEMLGDSVEITDGYRTWWSYVPHFINTPGYVYAYAYGQLLAMSIYQRYTEGGEAFVPAYLELLASGGSKSPEELGEIVGIDLADPGFWDSGLDLVEAQLEQAEAAAREARPEAVGA
ncbi:M3 family oligoendopeptidase [Svornostia abyssi]|uniref:M3 family oligoendopeptidase n=1 Tax=Svornostia abyssi TaxID=2898438 RepID=A0ABY5PA01_9ACTN|nr:M3 family oligoendopeptidase [Parviterribacteraceae bacterium J379]